jgi:transposase
MRRSTRVRVPPAVAAEVTVGVDTHAEAHTAAALDGVGRLLGTRTVPTTPTGFAELLAWASRWGPVARVGIEGTGSYGAGLARWLRARGVPVGEVDRPKRQVRRRRGKSDPLDAEAAARAVLAGAATAQPKAGDGPVEALRVLRLARRSAVKARTQVANRLLAVLVTAPAPRLVWPSSGHRPPSRRGIPGSPWLSQAVYGDPGIRLIGPGSPANWI